MINDRGPRESQNASRILEWGSHNPNSSSQRKYQSCSGIIADRVYELGLTRQTHYRQGRLGQLWAVLVSFYDRWLPYSCLFYYRQTEYGSLELRCQLWNSISKLKGLTLNPSSNRSINLFALEGSKYRGPVLSIVILSSSTLTLKFFLSFLMVRWALIAKAIGQLFMSYRVPLSICVWQTLIFICFCFITDRQMIATPRLSCNRILRE